MAILRAFVSAIAVAVGFLAISTGAYAQSPLGAPLFSVLNGGNECNSVALPAGPDCRKGDLDAIGSATILFPTTTSVCWGITADNLAGATAAHIHSGVSGLNGAIVVVLTPPNAPGAGNPGASSGCRSNVPVATIAAIRADPTRFYVNVHNVAFSAGAIRGQLH
jgi:hypothetical protein